MPVSRYAIMTFQGAAFEEDYKLFSQLCGAIYESDVCVPFEKLHVTIGLLNPKLDARTVFQIMKDTVYPEIKKLARSQDTITSGQCILQYWT